MNNKKNEMRIVSLAPSATSILCAIGARRLLVGVTKWCADVAPVAGLPKVGDCWRMDSAEEIARRKPAVVIGSVPFKGETIEKILQAPVTFVAMNPRTLADVERDIRLVARLVGRAAAGERAIGKMGREFRKIATRAKGRRVRVYCEAWPNPRISSPPWVAELAGICGGKMVVKAGEKVKEADVAAAQPEVIVLAWAATGARADVKKAYGVAEWKDVPAIKNRKVFVVRDELLNTPGPVLVRGAKALRKIFERMQNRT